MAPAGQFRTNGRLAAVCAALLLLAGCQAAGRAGPAAAAAPAPAGWRNVLRPDDAARLERVPEAWTEALAAARGAGFSRRIAAAGALLAPAAALGWAAPPPGPYRCRVTRLGAPRRPYAASAPYFCHVVDEGALLSLTKQTGAERPGGYLWNDGGRRMVFTGSTALGGERAPPAYGERAERDVVGILERIGPFRYRLVMPRPRGVVTLDVLELVPAIPAG